MLNYRELVEWRDTPQVVVDGSPDAYYYISRLKIEFGILSGLCFGISISVIIFILSGKKKIPEKLV